MDDDIETIYDAFDVSYKTRAQAELAMFRSACDLRAPPDRTLLEDMRLQRRREVFCVRTLLFLAQDAAERASALRRRVPTSPSV